MFCPQCFHPNPADVQRCVRCGQDVHDFRERLFIGRQFIFVQADREHPVALRVDDAVRRFDRPTILSRHRHAVGFGDEEPTQTIASLLKSRRRKGQLIPPLPDQPRLPHPSLQLLAVVTDRKVYRADDEATFFIVAPDAAGGEAKLEIRFAGNKVYEASLSLNQEGLALHRYADLREGEYTAVVSLEEGGQAECTFSVAEYTLSPLIATLEKHEYARDHLTFTLRLLRLSVPYAGPVEFGLQCRACGDRVIATQKVEAKEGLAQGDFDLSGHGGPFHVQVTTPDGNTALVAFPGTGAVERRRIAINRLGPVAEMGLLPWEEAQPVRGFYLGSGGVSMTPLTLESAHADVGQLQATSDLGATQVVVLDPRAGTAQVLEFPSLRRGQRVTFDVSAPYTLFTVGTFVKGKPFEGWGVVIKPVAFEARLTAPQTARPGEAIEVEIAITPPHADAPPIPAYCWLLVYDARLEHESPLPKLAKGIYESIRDATHNLALDTVASAKEQVWELPQDLFTGAPVLRGRLRSAARPPGMEGLKIPSPMAPEEVVEAAEVLELVVAPMRMEFPELAHLELFYLEGSASRTVQLGDQIGTWRVRAYLFKGADYRELTADVQADKPLYAELDLPAIASPGDEIVAAVNYRTRRPARLLIATPDGEKRVQVAGSGTEPFTLTGPGRVEVRLESEDEADWTVRDVAPPGLQKVTASRLVILDRGQTVRGERVVVYDSPGQVLQETITALIHYPFG